MRLPVSFAGGTGHWLPLSPLARASRSAGDQVLVTGQSAMLAVLAAAGFTAVDSGGRTLADPSMRRPLVPVDRAAEAAVISTVFAGSLARERAGRLIGIGWGWRPDVIVHDEADYGAAVAADALGLPRVEMAVLLAGGTVDRSGLAENVARSRAVFGLPAAAPGPALTLEPVPAGFRDPTDPLPEPMRRIRPAVLESGAGAPDPATTRTMVWLDRRPSRPVVHFTLGTIFHQESGDLFARVLAGLGLARVLDPLTATPAEIADAARDLLDEPPFRQTAAPWRAACAALPTAVDAVGWIRTLSAHRSAS